MFSVTVQGGLGFCNVWHCSPVLLCNLFACGSLSFSLLLRSFHSISPDPPSTATAGEPVAGKPDLGPQCASCLPTHPDAQRGCGRCPAGGTTHSVSWGPCRHRPGQWHPFPESSPSPALHHLTFWSLLQPPLCSRLALFYPHPMFLCKQEILFSLATIFFMFAFCLWRWDSFLLIIWGVSHRLDQSCLQSFSIVLMWKELLSSMSSSQLLGNEESWPAAIFLHPVGLLF